MQRCPGCWHLLVWKLTCFESRIIGLNLQGCKISRTYWPTSKQVPDKMNWGNCECIGICVILRYRFFALSVSLGGLQHRREYTLLQLQLLTQITNHLHTEKTRFQNISTVTTRMQLLCYVFLKMHNTVEPWPHMHQGLRQSAGWTWPPQVGLPVAQQPKWP